MDDNSMQEDPATAPAVSQPFIQLKNSFANNVMELNTNVHKTFSEVFPRDVKLFLVSGEPIQLTIECDYKTISITGKNHRIFISGICNIVNIGGTGHSIEFQGYTNQVNFLGERGSEITVMGNQFSHSVNVSNGLIKTEGVSLGKFDFDSKMKNGQRHRFAWKPAENPTGRGDWSDEMWEKI